MTKGKFISIEGTEGAGKSTALRYIAEYLSQTNIEVVFTREPGGTPLAEDMRNLVLHAGVEEKVEPEAELLLMFAGRAQHIKQKILPALLAGKWVVTDRFIDATYAYQGGGRRMDYQFIQLLDQRIVGDVYPDLTLLFDISPEQGFKRTENRGDKDRIEQEKMDFFVRVRETYLQRAREDAGRIKIIDASQSLEEVKEQLSLELNKFLAYCNQP